MSEFVHIGILFNLFVCTVIAVIALSFFIFLARKWNTLPLVLKGYAWFWFCTMLVWAGVATRYILVTFEPHSNLFLPNEIFIKSAIFISGTPLFFYVGLRVFHSKLFSSLLTFLSFLSSLVAIYLVFLPQGISDPIITNYSADTLLNKNSLLIFQINIVIIFLLLLFHVIKKFYFWFRYKTSKDLYRGLYSISLLVYVSLGAIDQLKLFVDWELIIFRIFYAAAFLMAYLITVQDNESKEEYFLENK